MAEVDLVFWVQQRAGNVTTLDTLVYCTPHHSGGESVQSFSLVSEHSLEQQRLSGELTASRTHQLPLPHAESLAMPSTVYDPYLTLASRTEAVGLRVPGKG